MTYEVRVEADHLAEGRPKAARGCPVYLAAYEVFGRQLLHVTHDGRIVLRTRRERFGEPAVMSPDDQARVAAAVRLVDAGRAAEVEPFAVLVSEPG